MFPKWRGASTGGDKTCITGYVLSCARDLTSLREIRQAFLLISTLQTKTVRIKHVVTVVSL